MAEAVKLWTVSETNRYRKWDLRWIILVWLSIFTAFPFLIVCTDEAFTSENWIVRIYQVRKEDPLGRDLKSANAFAEGKKRKRSKPASKRRAIV